MIKVRDRAHLRKLLVRGQKDFLIALAGGGLVSRKNIVQVSPNRYRLFNGIDGTTEVLSWHKLHEHTNIGRAIDRGAFFAEA